MAPSKKNADEAQEDMLNALLGALKPHQREGETPLQALERCLVQADHLRGLVGTGEARVLVVEHLGPEHTSFDSGGQYAVRYATAQAGFVPHFQEIQDLGQDSRPTRSMAWHVANDHLEDRILRWLKPEAYR
jgi:hypothetical protein